MTRSFQDLIAWQRGMDLVVAVYEVTASFPDNEKYGLVSQMRRSAVSIPSNIAEGKMRGSEREFRRFLDIALASAAELQTQIFIAKKIRPTRHLDFVLCEQLLDEALRLLFTLISNRLETEPIKS